MHTEHLEIRKTAKVCVTGDPSTARVVIIALHGYGHLAQFFARKFEPLASNGVCTVVPEGLHRFYLSGNSGRVGASWMTKEERQVDIQDYVRYLDDVWMWMKEQVPSQARRVLLGFSQGGATASRWHVGGTFQAQNFILHSAVLPPDLDWELDPRIFSNSRNVLLTGIQDEYRSLDQCHQDLEQWKDQGIDFELVRFEGGHEVNLPGLKNILDLVDPK